VFQISTQSVSFIGSKGKHLKNNRQKFWIFIAVLSLLIIVGLQVGRQFYFEEERQVRIRLRKTIEQKFPEKVKDLRAVYGIEKVDGHDFNKAENTEKPDVILVHGLDDPGKVWMDLAPELINDGFHVWNMTYPNDQPIVESARFFFEEMVSLKTKGRNTVSIVAHSMGGLVAREMLSSPELAYMQSARGEDVPVVAQLIMVGTPNHGSELARFRIFTEFRDQLTALFTGNYSWLQGIIDGAGEAGIDLIPGSSFLETLNSRPHPKNVKMLVIAGVMSTWETTDIEKFIHKIKIKLPHNTHEAVAKIGDLLNSMAHGVGDGLVSVDSARLDGVPLHIVQGTHLSIIRNIRLSSQKVPPAVPIVVEYLMKGTFKS
jgi:pimeloyl-ACP methyl ester carboxylesterase